jgi:hypothetical protein
MVKAQIFDNAMRLFDNVIHHQTRALEGRFRFHIKGQVLRPGIALQAQRDAILTLAYSAQGGRAFPPRPQLM